VHYWREGWCRVVFWDEAGYQLEDDCLDLCWVDHHFAGDRNYCGVFDGDCDQRGQVGVDGRVVDGG
jgi:hypothetical protein